MWVNVLTNGELCRNVGFPEHFTQDFSRPAGRGSCHERHGFGTSIAVRQPGASDVLRDATGYFFRTTIKISIAQRITFGMTAAAQRVEHYEIATYGALCVLMLHSSAIERRQN